MERIVVAAHGINEKQERMVVNAVRKNPVLSEDCVSLESLTEILKHNKIRSRGRRG